MELSQNMCDSPGGRKIKWFSDCILLSSVCFLNLLDILICFYKMVLLYSIQLCPVVFSSEVMLSCYAAMMKTKYINIRHIKATVESMKYKLLEHLIQIL